MGDFGGLGCLKFGAGGGQDQGSVSPAAVGLGSDEAAGPRRDSLGRSYATGKRKSSIARLWLKPGSGKITINGRDLASYFVRPISRAILMKPLVLSQRESQYDVVCTVKGGGLSGQAGAVLHGLSKALVFMEPGLRPVIKGAGLLTRDNRVVERKKCGRRKARKRFQFSKR